MKRLLHATAVAGVVMAFSAPAQAVEWRGWNIHPPGYPNTEGLEFFADAVAERTEGRVEPTVYNNGVLGNQPDAIEQVRQGALDFGNFNLGPMGPVVPAVNVVSLPFIFKSSEHMYRVMDGEVGQMFADAMAEKGIIALSWYDSGARSFYNTQRPVRTPEDVQGMKVRVMNNELYVDMVEALGGNGTPMAFAEVYQALNNGVIDGAENNYPSYESTNHYEVAQYYSLTEHLIIPECVCISKQSWDELSEEDQEIVRQAAIESAEMQRELWQERSQKSREAVMEGGVEINEVENKEAFQQAMEPVYASFIEENPDLEPIIRAIQNVD